ncbi:SinR family protein [Sporolactobacillus laevolacticus]|uniref:SinR family protein n=1 Tax=Sporolactobacillus laevolacticus DSM 442 TaxID=1395513 RepID=V6J2V1_9BACL|nr:SinR family protein [Sporolactobacillus laevolacticus]EST11119.1 SinR family protein [Sporolactobacillus laevolacticus DSM 442]
MASYLVTYDLDSNDADYPDLFRAIESIGPNRHIQKSVWIVKSSSMSSSQVRDFLIKTVHADDSLIVVTVGSNWAAFNIDKEDSKWMTANIYS